MDNSENISSRRAVWDWASEMVDPIIDKHTLKDLNSGPIFTNSPVSKVDQHIEHILRVADWLLGTPNT